VADTVSFVMTKAQCTSPSSAKQLPLCWFSS